MICPMCDGKVRVIDSKADYDAVYRKRKCNLCCHVFYTEETESNDAKAIFNDLANNYHKKFITKGNNQNE